jgi:hypothetical protein
VSNNWTASEIRAEISRLQNMLRSKIDSGPQVRISVPTETGGYATVTRFLADQLPLNADWIAVPETPDSFYERHGVWGVAAFFQVYTPDLFQKQHVVYWNCDLPYNGGETGWEGFPHWRSISHWKILDKIPTPPTLR